MLKPNLLLHQVRTHLRKAWSEGSKVRAYTTRFLGDAGDKLGSCLRWAWGAFGWRTALLGCGILLGIVSAVILVRTHQKFSSLIDKKLAGEVFGQVAQVYAAPRTIRPGQRMGPERLSAYLRNAGYQESQTTKPRRGEYVLSEKGLEIILPSTSGDAALTRSVEVSFKKNVVLRIQSLPRGRRLRTFELEPELITNISDQTREKRRLIGYSEVPLFLRDAVLAIEDRRFFSHRGFDFVSIISAGLGGFKRGASTITQQLVRSPSFWLTRERSLIRKAKEICMAFILETRLSKEEIFTLYANDVYMGQRGSFSINGFAEAARSYFGKGLKGLSVSESAFLAGLIQSPNRYNPTRHPDRAVRRRNTVLQAMLEANSISKEQFQQAVKAPLKIAPVAMDVSHAPYFVDLIKKRLLEKYSEQVLFHNGLEVYTTLDLELQQIAYRAVKQGAQRVDELLAKRQERKNRRQSRSRGKNESQAQVQACLVALDPETGSIKALVGGRDYKSSQLNRVTAARRQPGSIFKPFVFATGLHSALSRSEPLITPSTMVIDAPTVFEFDQENYEPNNYAGKFLGPVTLRTSLIKSLNVATVKFAQAAGLRNVVTLARRAGVKSRLRPTPALALGAYEVTPLEMAQAFTIFANHGKAAEPRFIRAIRNVDEGLIERTQPRTRAVLDPQVAYLMTHLMKEVIDGGTGTRVRTLGFTQPAAGKTGTSNDGWFAGYTRGLLCIVWVGFDDNRELGLEGAQSALPIWTEFMKHSVHLRPWLAEGPLLPAESGLIEVLIDPDTGLRASSECEDTTSERYLPGSEPAQLCGLMAHHRLSEQRLQSRDTASHPPSLITSRPSDAYLLQEVFEVPPFDLALENESLPENHPIPVGEQAQPQSSHQPSASGENVAAAATSNQQVSGQEVSEPRQARRSEGRPVNALGNQLETQRTNSEIATEQTRTFHVIHDHAFGGCPGRLSVSGQSIAFRPARGSGHGFRFRLSEVIGTNLRNKLKIRFKHRTYPFTARFARNRPDNWSQLNSIMQHLARLTSGKTMAIQ